MTLMLKILSVIGWIILAILFLLVWIIIVPRHFYIEYSKQDSLIIKMNIAFFKLRLFPFPKILAVEDREKKNQRQSQKHFEENKTYKDNAQTHSSKVEKTIENNFDVYQSDEKLIRNDSEKEKNKNEQISNIEKDINSKDNLCVEKENNQIEKNVEESIFNKEVSKTKHSKKNKVKMEEEIREKIMLPEPFDDIQLTFSLVKQIISAAKGIMKKILRAIKFSDVSFTVPIYDDDPMKTQQKYAAATTGFYALSMFLQKNMQFYYKSPIFIADFANRHSESTYFYCKISTSPVLLLSAAYFAYRQFKLIIKNNRQAQIATEKER